VAASDAEYLDGHGDRPDHRRLARRDPAVLMRLHVLSDLHLERGIGNVPVTDADVVVLAGDIARGPRGVQWAREWAGKRPVIYVAGNHEYYGYSIPEALGELRDGATGSSVHVLEHDEVIIGGVRFLGCTLWSDFDFDGPEQRTLAMRVCARAVSDYHVIRSSNGDGAVRPEDTRALHLASRAWLSERPRTTAVRRLWSPITPRTSPGVRRRRCCASSRARS
jgi:hypothetical protein